MNMNMKTKTFLYLPFIVVVAFAQLGCGRQNTSAAKKETPPTAKPVCPSAPNSQDEVNKLVAAAESGEAAIVKASLDCGTDVNGRGVPSSSTSLMLATQNGQADIVRMLLDRGAEMNPSQTLMSAALWGYSDIIGMLLDKGADINTKDANKKTALYYASLAGNADTVDMLLKRGADKKQKTKWSSNDFLKGTIAEVDAKNQKIKALISSPLMFAEKGAEVPLDASEAKYFGAKRIEDLRRGDAVTVHYTLQMTIGGFNFATGQASGGASYKIQQISSRHSALSPAISGTAQETKSIPTPDELVKAAADGDLKAVQFILSEGRAVNSKGKDGSTALAAASLQGHREVVQALLTNGADINAQSSAGMSALMWACATSKSPEVVRDLLARGAAVNARDPRAGTALMNASGGNFPDIPAEKAEENKLSIVQALLTSGAEVDARNKDGATALIFASSNSHRGIVQLLLDKGADSKAKNSDGKTALDVASDPEIRTLLQRSAALGRK